MIFSTLIIDSASLEMAEEEDTVVFWKKLRKTLPLLSRLARIYHSIQASSAESERKFSSAVNFSTMRRSQLSVSTLESQTFVQANYDALKKNAEVKLFEQ